MKMSLENPSLANWVCRKVGIFAESPYTVCRFLWNVLTIIINN